MLGVNRQMSSQWFPVFVISDTFQEISLTSVSKKTHRLSIFILKNNYIALKRTDHKSPYSCEKVFSFWSELFLTNQDDLWRKIFIQVPISVSKAILFKIVIFAIPLCSLLTSIILIQINQFGEKVQSEVWKNRHMMRLVNESDHVRLCQIAELHAHVLR